MSLANSQDDKISMRPASPADIPTLRLWDQEAHVIAAISEDGQPIDEGWEWETEIVPRDDGTEFWMAELDGVPFGFLQIINPATERSQYWGPMPEGYRALDIWIGPATYLGQGLGSQMMQWALSRCFGTEGVTQVLIDPLYTNKRAHRFYRRHGFQDIKRRRFDEQSDCLVMGLRKADFLAQTP